MKVLSSILVAINADLTATNTNEVAECGANLDPTAIEECQVSLNISTVLNAIYRTRQSSMAKHGSRHSVVPILRVGPPRMIHAHIPVSRKLTVPIVFTNTTLAINSTVTAREAVIPHDSICTGLAIIQDTGFGFYFTSDVRL